MCGVTSIHSLPRLAAFLVAHSFVTVAAAAVLLSLLAAVAAVTAGEEQVLVVFPWESFGCSITTASSSSSSAHASSTSTRGSGHGDPSVSPVVYIRYEPASGPNWIVEQMHVAWWNASLVLSTLPPGRQFVVLCVGIYIHCDTTPAVVNGSSFGVCVSSTPYSNFLPTASSVFIHPTVDGYGVIGPFCELSNSFWGAAAHEAFAAPQDVFTSFGTRVLPRSLNTTAPDPVPCLGNGRCIATRTGNVTRSLQLSALCECRGSWADHLCTRCDCATPNGSTCMTIAGSCTAAVPPNSTAAPVNRSAAAKLMAQGVVVVLLRSRWYGHQLHANQTQIRFNTGNISFAALEWELWYMQDVDVDSPRWGTFDASPYGDGTWMMAVLPGNLAQFVFYNAVVGDYIHCTNDQVIRGISDASLISVNNNSQLAAAELEGTFQCVADQVNSAMNFAAIASIVAVTESEFRVLRATETGCQYGLSDGQSDTALLCSGHGTCSGDTYFRCQCPGNYTGVACEVCDCPRGAMCDGFGQCVCSPGFELCLGDSWCTNVTDDVTNCGGCGNDCTAGIASAVRHAACVQGVCVVEMVNPMNWLLCFGEEYDQSTTSGGGGSSLTSDSVTHASDASTPAAPSVSCFRGFDFAVVLAVSFPLFAVSTVAFCRLRWQHGQMHKHRQALFVLLALIGGLRASYSVVALLFLATSRTPDDAVRSRQFFAATMITLNAYADLFAGFIDVLLTVYWLFVLDRIQVFPQRLLLVGCTCMAATLTVASVVDYCTTNTAFVYTFFTVAILLFFTAMMHMIVVIEVFAKFLAWHRSGLALEGGDSSFAAGAGATPASTSRAFISPRYVAVDGQTVNGPIGSSPLTLATHEDIHAGSHGSGATTSAATNAAVAVTSPEASPRREQRPRVRVPALVTATPATPRAIRTATIVADDEQHLALPRPALRRQFYLYVHFLRVTMIAFVCLVCWMVRSVMLLGRATKTPIFYTGALSFNDPTFTLVYLTLLTLFPCIVIALIWVGISFDLLRIATGASAPRVFENHPPTVVASRSISMTEKNMNAVAGASQESTPLLRVAAADIAKDLGQGPNKD